MHGVGYWDVTWFQGDGLIASEEIIVSVNYMMLRSVIEQSSS